jgi:hypothetical protein
MNILSNGLQLSSNTRLGYHGFRNRIYLSKDNPAHDADFVNSLITGSIFVNKESDLNKEIAILKVKVPEAVATYKDPEFSSSGVYVEEEIPATNISVDFEGTLKELYRKYG